MKNAPIACRYESALNKRKYNIGELPERCHTVQADILAALLDGGKPLTAFGAAQKYGTTRLSAVIYALEKKYGWQVERTEVRTHTTNGRFVVTTGYKLPQATIKGARKVYGSSWSNIVKGYRELRYGVAKQHMLLELTEDSTWENLISKPEFAKLVNHLYGLWGNT